VSIIKGKELTNVLQGFTPKSEIYSAWYDKNSNCVDDGNGEHTLIDHITLTAGLRVKSVRFDRSYKASCTSIMSDHWPLVVDIHTTDKLVDENSPVLNSALDTPSHEGNGSVTAIMLSAGLAFVLLLVGLILFTIYRKRKNNNNNKIDEESVILEKI